MLHPSDLAARERITATGTSIYAEPSATHLLSIPQLERMLIAELRGMSLAFPLRTRAKITKQAVCRALGYPVPSSFQKTRPRFPSQNLDVYVQKNNNLQIWNEEIDATRRYALIRVDERDCVTAVRVLTGEEVALLDKTGTLTSKYQARRRDDVVAERPEAVLVSACDTEVLRRALAPASHLDAAVLGSLSPVQPPSVGCVLSIDAIFRALQPIVGREIHDPGVLQDRNRGAGLHRLVCEALSLQGYADNGQFPDIQCQALEVKLQTSPTIDLGLVSPDSKEAAPRLGAGLRHCDVRYAVFYGNACQNSMVRISGLVLLTGEDFFSEFRRFEGLRQNRKLQIPLPRQLFAEPEG